MNKIIIISLLLFSSVVLANFIESSAHKKIHYNSILFSGHVSNDKINFKITDHCISPGQPYENTVGLTSKLKKTRHTSIEMRGLNIRVGRHASVKVVNCLKKNLMHATNIGPRFTFDHDPHKLNFAVIGTLSINGKYFDNIVLAQGNTPLSNNWWFGGKRCDNCQKSSPVINCVTCTARDNTKWCFTRGKNGSKAIKAILTNEVHIGFGKCF